MGERNLGQLVRERHPGEVVDVGVTTSDGTVTAADDGTARPVATTCGRRPAWASGWAWKTVSKPRSQTTAPSGMTSRVRSRPTRPAAPTTDRRASIL